jgi:hypothetical protein
MLCPYQQILNKMQGLARDKHSSLFCATVSDKDKELASLKLAKGKHSSFSCATLLIDYFDIDVFTPQNLSNLLPMDKQASLTRSATTRESFIALVPGPLNIL